MKYLPSLPRPSSRVVRRIARIAIWNIALPCIAVVWLITQLSVALDDATVARAGWLLVPAILWHQITRIDFQQLRPLGPLQMVFVVFVSTITLFGTLLLLVIAMLSEPMNSIEMTRIATFLVHLSMVIIAFALFIATAMPRPSNPISSDDLRALRRLATAKINARRASRITVQRDKSTNGRAKLLPS